MASPLATPPTVPSVTLCTTKPCYGSCAGDHALSMLIESLVSPAAPGLATSAAASYKYPIWAQYKMCFYIAENLLSSTIMSANIEESPAIKMGFGSGAVSQLR